MLFKYLIGNEVYIDGIKIILRVFREEMNSKVVKSGDSDFSFFC